MNNYVMALFASGTTNFDYMGLGPLADAISAVATETATSNGNITYTMEMDYPINGRLASQLVEGNLIKAQVSKTPGDYMIFEINETLKSDDRTITVYCDAYAKRILRMSFDNGGKFGSFGNVQQALNAARAQMTGIQSDFTLSSGIGTSLNMSGVTSKNTLPTTYQDFNAYLDAIMDKVQGNVRFGVNSIQIVSDRGRDITDTVLRDDKNTNGISIKVDTSNIVNRIIPMLPVKDKNGNVTQDTKVGKIVTSSVAFKFINFYAGQVVSLDTQDLANSYFNRTNCDRPTTTATVQTSMLDEDLTDIRLFDRIQVYSSKIGYQAKLKVCERAFDILAGAVSEFKLGSSSVTIFNSQTSVVNAINSAVQSSQYAAITADGKNTAYYEGANPDNPKENDLWFHSVNGINQIDQYVNGNWVTIVSDSTGEEINKKVSEVGAEAKSAVSQAESASEKATQLALKYDDTNSLASQAMNKAVSAQGDASSAVAAANSTASEFGKVDQKADSAVASALNAQSAASDSVKQASSAAADSKDAKQIAGAVRQSYKTLTDGSTMTIAELQSGLAVKLTKSDLDGYATQTWTQNQVKLTADGINGTLSSVKTTVDSHDTSINELKADSSSFKSQFTTVNNALGKQTTDISTLQASSKELTSGFNTLTSDNTTNKNDISQLKQSATEVSSTLETVQTQVQNSAVGTNLLLKTYNPFIITGNNTENQFQQMYALSRRLEKGTTVTISFDAISTAPAKFSVMSNGLNSGDWTGVVTVTDTEKKHYAKSMTLHGFADLGFNIRLDNIPSTTTITISNMKLELGSNATDYSTNPLDNATVTAFSKISQTVDDIKIDISKKIEQKDLNGYATQTWAQNQIKTTADGISGTLSTVKTTVDRHDTSINELKADSSSFKTQFTTVTGTLDKQSTDISTLQVSSKSLSANFDSLSSDNQTNQHNISQLQASATEFNSTLMTVQQRVTDSAVGTNLLLKTGTPFSMTGNNTNNQWAQIYALSRRLEAGTTVTLSFDVVSTASAQFTLQNNANGDGAGGTWMAYIYNTADTTKKHYVATIKLDGFGQQGINLRLDNVPSTTTITFSNMKLELGSYATDYSANPADNATVTAVSSISQTIDSIQTTVRGKVDNDIYQSKMTQLDNQITSVVGQVNTLGQRNLIANSQFQYDKFDGSTWTSDNASNWYSSDNRWSWWNGYQGICCNIPISNPVNTNQWNSIVSKKIYVPDPASVYSASAIFNVDTVGDRTQLVLDWYDQSMKRIGYATKGVTIMHTQNLIKIENQTPPAGTAYVALHIDVSGGGHLAVIAPMLVNAASVGSYVPDNASWTEFQQTASDINLKVSKDGVINAINISNEGTTIYGNKLHITANTYIDNAVIKDAMIAELNASKLHAGRIDASKIDVYNLNGANINAYSITADKLQAGAMLIAMNSTLQTLKIGTDGLYTTNASGTSIGKIHANNLVQHPENWGLDMDLSSTGQYMAWGAQNEGDPTGGYVIKFGWTRNSSASDFGMPWGGFWFNDNVMLHKNLRFDGGGVDVAGAYQLMKFAWIEMNGIHYPFFGSSNLKAGWLFGSNETYLVRGGGVINASKILGVLNGQSYKFIKSLNPDGSVKVYTDVHF